MNTRDEVLVVLGMNSEKFAAQSELTLRMEKAAAADYVKYWNDATNAVDRKQAEFAVKQAARAEKSIAFWKAQQTAMAGFGGASVPVGWGAGKSQAVRDIEGAGGSISGSYAFGKGGQLLGKIGDDGKLMETTAKDMVSAGKNIHNSTSIIREVFVLFREALAGRWKNFGASLTRLGSLALGGGLLVDAGLVALGVGAIAGPSAYRTWQARTSADANQKQFQGRLGSEAGDLRQRIELMKRLGIIDPKTAQGYLDSIKGDKPSEDAVMSVLGATNKLMPKGGLDALESMVAQKSLDKQINQKYLDYQRDEATDPRQKYKLDTENIARIQAEMVGMDAKSTEYAEKKLELVDALIQQQRDINEINKSNTEEEKKQTEEAKKKAEAQKVYDSKVTELNDKLRRERTSSNRYGSPTEFSPYIPTVEELASGNGFMTRTNSYKKWLAANSPLKGMARDLVRAQLYLARDVSFGAGSDVIGGDISRITQLRGNLAQAGILSPNEKLDLVNDSVQETTKAINDLNAAATTSGLVIKAGN